VITVAAGFSIIARTPQTGSWTPHRDPPAAPLPGPYLASRSNSPPTYSRRGVGSPTSIPSCGLVSGTPDTGFDTRTWQLAWALDTLLPRGHRRDYAEIWQAARSVTDGSTLDPREPMPLATEPVERALRRQAAAGRSCRAARRSTGAGRGARPRGFVLDMDVVFEIVVCAPRSGRHWGRVVGAWAARPPMYLDIAGRVEIKPDFAFRPAG
jgi:hypothetical protein